MSLQIPLGGPDQTVGDPGLRQVRGLCLVGSGPVRVRAVEFGMDLTIGFGRVVSKFHYTSPRTLSATRPN